MKSLRNYEQWSPQEKAEHEDDLRRERERREAERKRLEARAEAEAVAALRIPSRLLDLVRSELSQTDAMEALVNPAPIVCLSGNPGTGKTVAAARWLFTHRPGLFVKAAELARWDRYDGSEMRRLLDAKHLVLDDLGTEYQDAKGNFAAILDELIDHRYDHGLPLVMTTNLMVVEEFIPRYGERIADRMRERGRFVSISAASMRSKS